MSIEYKYMLYDNDPENVDECACCNSAAPLHGFDQQKTNRPFGETEKVNYCELCANTMISNSHQYPDQYREDRRTLQAIAAVSNIVLDKTTDRLKELETLKSENL